MVEFKGGGVLVESVRKGIISRLLYLLTVKYPTPSNLTYVWNFGVFGLVTLLLQIITGLILVMHYTPNIELSFISIEHIMRDVNYGWIIRYAHAKVLAFFLFVFIFIYLEDLFLEVIYFLGPYYGYPGL